MDLFGLLHRYVYGLCYSIGEGGTNMLLERPFQFQFQGGKM